MAEETVKSDENTYVLSLGGSIMMPDMVDVEFLKAFKEFILKHVTLGQRFVIITGGGKVCRRYQAALAEISPSASKEALDWLGLWTTQVNAQLVRHMFGDEADLIENFNPSLPITSNKKIIVGAGYEPGHSTDNDTVLIAKNIGAKHIVNMSNIDYVYDKDPKKYSDAVKIEEISWDDFIALLPEEWDPGLNSPFDPIAAREARELGLTVSMVNGKKLDQVEKCLLHEKFEGTLIK